MLLPSPVPCCVPPSVWPKGLLFCCVVDVCCVGCWPQTLPVLGWPKSDMVKDFYDGIASGVQLAIVDFRLDVMCRASEALMKKPAPARGSRRKGKQQQSSVQRCAFPSECNPRFEQWFRCATAQIFAVGRLLSSLLYLKAAFFSR